MTRLSLPFIPWADSTAVSHLRREFDARRDFFNAQTALVQRFLEAQAQVVAGAIVQKPGSVRFALPDQIIVTPAAPMAPLTAALPADQREHKVGGLTFDANGSDLGDKVRQRLTGLEQSADPAVAVSAGLLRYAIARHMVHSMLPTGRTVSYVAAEGEETPSLPDPRKPEVASALTQATDAVAEEGPGGAEEEPGGAARGELHVPYVPFARRFYLPQWVAFDANDKLLAGTLPEAEARIGSMQRFVAVLHAAVAMAAYFVADDAYQQKRYGILGQLINQGRALARYQTRQIIGLVLRRALAQELNRGLSLSLPYFDDQALKLKVYPFVVIPAGRIMFVPAFVTRAVREEACRVAQDTRLSPSTRKHLLAELALLEQAFAAPARAPEPRPMSAALSMP
jgi:hypothetical protein